MLIYFYIADACFFYVPQKIDCQEWMILRVNKLTIFQKIILLIVLLLLPIFLLYLYSNTVSMTVLKNEIQSSMQRRLSFLQSRLDIQLNNVVRSAFQLCSDPTLKLFPNISDYENYFDVITFKKHLEERIAIQSTTLDWPVQISVFFPKVQQVISTDSSVLYEDDYLSNYVANSWIPRKMTDAEPMIFNFYFYAVNPYNGYSQPTKADVVVEIKYSDKNIVNMLDDYKKTGQSDPFIYHKEYGVIQNSRADSKLVSEVAVQLDQQVLKDSDSFLADLNGSSYLVYYIRSTAFDGVLVDYVPVQQILAPITKSNYLFYASIFLLLLMSLLAAFMLYRNVQIPIGKMMKGLQKVKQGDFSARIENTKNEEFKYAFQCFNEMAEQIQQLIKEVYLEQLTTRDAQLKQMQSQINPHFLYNCLYYIVNMTRLGKDEAVDKMATNLGEYFKYTTRLEKQDASLEEEIRLIVNYLEIQILRMNRFHYTIDIPEEMLTLEIPRLLLQPVVENAVVHGVEPKVGIGHIRISGKAVGSTMEISVEDDGIGVSEEKLQELSQQLKMPMDSHMGYGIWNVNQRLILRYGEGSGISYSRAESGGLMVKLVWNIPTA